MKKDKEGNDIPLTHYKCSPRCKQLTGDEVMSILSFRQVFDKPIEDIIRVVHNCDTCPHVRHRHRCNLIRMVLYNWSKRWVIV